MEKLFCFRTVIGRGRKRAEKYSQWRVLGEVRLGLSSLKLVLSQPNQLIM